VHVPFPCQRRCVLGRLGRGVTATRSLGLTARSGAPTHLPRGRPPADAWLATSGKFGTYPVAGYAVPMNATTAAEAADEFAALWERAWVRAPSARATQRQ